MSSDAQNPNNNVYEKILKLLGSILKMVTDGTRDPHKVAEILQSIVDQPANAIKKAVEKTIERLLEDIGEVTVPAFPVKFVTRNKFKSKQDGGIFSYLGANFVHWFLSGKGKTEFDKGKIEDPSAEHIICCKTMANPSLDKQIIEELGGEAKAETTMADIDYLINQLKKDEDKDLLHTNGSVNLFYVRDFAGVLRTIRLTWSADGWKVVGFVLSDPSGRLIAMTNSRVFSRKSVLSPSKNFGSDASKKSNI